jgi:hypothetical protein
VVLAEVEQEGAVVLEVVKQKEQEEVPHLKQTLLDPFRLSQGRLARALLGQSPLLVLLVLVLMVAYHKLLSFRTGIVAMKTKAKVAQRHPLDGCQHSHISPKVMVALVTRALSPMMPPCMGLNTPPTRF